MTDTYAKPRIVRMRKTLPDGYQFGTASRMFNVGRGWNSCHGCGSIFLGCGCEPKQAERERVAQRLYDGMTAGKEKDLQDDTRV